MIPHTQHNTRRVHTGEEEPRGQGHRTRNRTRRAYTPVNRSPVAQDTAHGTPNAERTQRCTGANWPRTPHTQHNTRSVHTGEKEASEAFPWGAWPRDAAVTRTSKQAGKALRSQGHQYAGVM